MTLDSTGYLLDTNILLALIRGNPLGEQIERAFGLRSDLNRCMISVVTVGEMLSLVHQFDWGTRKQEALHQLLDQIVWIDISHPDILDAYGELDALCREQGNKMGKNDVWIAATANATNIPLLTTDRDFDHLNGTHIELVWVDPQAN